MQFQELLEKYNLLLQENKHVKEENQRLKSQLAELSSVPSGKSTVGISPAPHPFETQTKESVLVSINLTSETFRLLS